MNMKISSAVLFALSAVVSPSTAFSPPKHGAVFSRLPLSSEERVVGRSKVIMMAQIPLVENWKILRDGSVYGTVTGHPTIEDGTPITTSPLADPEKSANGKIVVTEAGSKYKLGVSEKGKADSKKPVKKQVKTPAKASPAKKPVVVAKKEVAKPKPKKKEVVAKPVSAPVSGPSLKEKKQLAIKEFGLNGKTVGDGKYLLCGKSFRSTSGKSQLFFAYQADADGLPTGPKLIVKLSTNFERLENENSNYNKVTNGLFSGSFVKKIDFLPQANGKGFEKQGALILEAGERNLKSVREAREVKMSRGLEGKAMRQAAVALAQCVQAMHTSGLVWTDLKAENFVVVSDSIGEGSIDGVKGIDLESCVPVRGSPLDYSPEACPPEFAEALLSGYGAEFQVDYHYDIWSFGMLLYELAVGKTYFAGKNPSQITKQLRFSDFEADVSAVSDARLRDLIGQCLQRDPNKRPGITQILLHPYFLTTGIGSFSF